MKKYVNNTMEIKKSININAIGIKRRL
ncbi:MAG: hypothetical protein C5S41_02050 [Candidatus Methanomarinus sp.]|nr:MAG: hypothetical protein C5S41_02050 [ANME-2 cluster archaeon]